MKHPYFVFKVGKLEEGWDIIPVEPESIPDGNLATIMISIGKIGEQMPDFAQVEMTYMGVGRDIVCLLVQHKGGASVWVIDQFSEPRELNVRMS